MDRWGEDVVEEDIFEATVGAVNMFCLDVAKFFGPCGLGLCGTTIFFYEFSADNGFYECSEGSFIL